MLQRLTPTPADAGRRATIGEAKPGLKIESVPGPDGELRWLITPRTLGHYDVTWSFTELCGEGNKPCPQAAVNQSLCDAGDESGCPDSAARSSFTFDGANGGQGMLVSWSLSDGEPEVCTVKAAFTWQSDGRRGSERATYTCSGASALGWPLLAVAFLAAVAAATVLVRRRNLWPR